jgi:fluoroacetyl-CoA thioesterase
MKNPFTTGDKLYYTKQITQQDTAAFDSGQVHPVYATFALGRDAEWACRQFVLQMKEGDEEGIGTFLTVNHHSPALIGENILFEAEVKSVNQHELICSYTARVNERLVATGETGQKILKKEKLEALFQRLSSQV